MGKIVSGIFNGTGAALYACIGFVPDWVKLYNLEDADEAWFVWNRHMARCADNIQGIQFVGSTGATQQAGQTTAGIEPYYGGDEMTTTNQTSVTYGEGVYLGFDNADYKETDAVTVDIDTWTLDTAGNRTGHFNGDITGTYVGEGSEIVINGKMYTIVALTAGQGVSADEVTLNQAAPSGPVTFIGGKYGLKPIAIGKVAPAGFKLNATSVINVNDESVMFEAGTYDK